MTDPQPPGSKPPGNDDLGAPFDLAEARAARAFAEALEGKDVPLDDEAADALETAALVASARAIELDPATKERLAVELFGPTHTEKPSRRRWYAYGVAAATAIAASVLVFVGARAILTSSPTPPHLAEQRGTQGDAPAKPLRDEAQILVAALLPPGGSPAGRARAVADEARARLQAAQEGRAWP